MYQETITVYGEEMAIPTGDKMEKTQAANLMEEKEGTEILSLKSKGPGKAISIFASKKTDEHLFTNTIQNGVSVPDLFGLPKQERSVDWKSEETAPEQVPVKFSSSENIKSLEPYQEMKCIPPKCLPPKKRGILRHDFPHHHGKDFPRQHGKRVNLKKQKNARKQSIQKSLAKIQDEDNLQSKTDVQHLLERILEYAVQNKTQFTIGGQKCNLIPVPVDEDTDKDSELSDDELSLDRPPQTSSRSSIASMSVASEDDFPPQRFEPSFPVTNYDGGGGYDFEGLTPFKTFKAGHPFFTGGQIPQIPGTNVPGPVPSYRSTGVIAPYLADAYDTTESMEPLNLTVKGSFSNPNKVMVTNKAFELQNITEEDQMQGIETTSTEGMYEEDNRTTTPPIVGVPSNENMTKGLQDGNIAEHIQQGTLVYESQHANNASCIQHPTTDLILLAYLLQNKMVPVSQEGKPGSAFIASNLCTQTQANPVTSAVYNNEPSSSRAQALPCMPDLTCLDLTENDGSFKETNLEKAKRKLKKKLKKN